MCSSYTPSLAWLVWVWDPSEAFLESDTLLQTLVGKSLRRSSLHAAEFSASKTVPKIHNIESSIGTKDKFGRFHFLVCNIMLKHEVTKLKAPAKLLYASSFFLVFSVLDPEDVDMSLRNVCWLSMYCKEDMYQNIEFFSDTTVRVSNHVQTAFVTTLVFTPTNLWARFDPKNRCS